LVRVSHVIKNNAHWAHSTFDFANMITVHNSQ
jgi:hypothetical protein